MFEGKIALVTGASRGIGEAIALDLAKNGADVAINYGRDKESAGKVAEKIRDMGRKALLVQANVADAKEVQDMMEAIRKEFGHLDLLVNNAGVVRDRTVKNMAQEEWDKVIETNLTGTFNVTKAALAIMRDNGSIVSISSVVGMNGNFGQANYAASKAGIIGFTKSLAKEVAKRNIRVNTVAPGFIETEMTKGIPYIRKVIVKFFIPLKRLGSVEDIAHTVSFLLSDKAAYITGQAIRVDGGLMF